MGKWHLQTPSRRGRLLSWPERKKRWAADSSQSWSGEISGSANFRRVRLRTWAIQNGQFVGGSRAGFYSEDRQLAEFCGVAPCGCRCRAGPPRAMWVGARRSMAYFERMRDVIHGPMSEAILRERMAAGWQLVSIEWRRELPDSEAPTQGA